MEPVRIGKGIVSKQIEAFLKKLKYPEVRAKPPELFFASSHSLGRNLKYSPSERPLWKSKALLGKEKKTKTQQYRENRQVKN